MATTQNTENWTRKSDRRLWVCCMAAFRKLVQRQLWGCCVETQKARQHKLCSVFHMTTPGGEIRPHTLFTPCDFPFFCLFFPSLITQSSVMDGWIKHEVANYVVAVIVLEGLVCVWKPYAKRWFRSGSLNYILWLCWSDVWVIFSTHRIIKDLMKNTDIHIWTIWSLN